jgi:hypothetical protein
MNGRCGAILTALGAAALLLSTIGGASPRYIWNASKSVLIGLCRLQPAGRLIVTELVALQPPDPLATFLISMAICQSVCPCSNACWRCLGRRCAETGSPLPSMALMWVRHSNAMAEAGRCQFGKDAASLVKTNCLS